jgi:hypothetical protein
MTRSDTITVAEAAKRLGVSVVWVRKLCRRLGIVRVTKSWHLRKPDLTRLKSARKPLGRPAKNLSK